MTWNLIGGKSKEEVIKKIYPIIKAHYKNDDRFESIFDEMLGKAINLFEIYEGGGKFSI